MGQQNSLDEPTRVCADVNCDQEFSSRNKRKQYCTERCRKRSEGRRYRQKPDYKKRRQAEHQRRISDPTKLEKKRESDRIYQQRPEVKERKATYKRQWKKDNPDKVKAQHDRSQAKQREKTEPARQERKKRTARRKLVLLLRRRIVQLKRQERNSPEQVEKRRQVNRQRQREYDKMFRLENPELYRAKQTAKKHRRRAMKRNAINPDDPAPLRTELLRMQGGKCANCEVSGKGVVWTVDHIIAFENGGMDSGKNVQILCLSCNSSKKDKDPHEWARQNGRLFWYRQGEKIE